MVPALGPHKTSRKSKVANYLLEKGPLTTVLPHAPSGTLFYFPLDASCLYLKSCRCQNKNADLYLASLGTISSHQKGSLVVTYGIMGDYRSLLPGDQITQLRKVKKSFTGDSVGNSCWKIL